MMRVASHWKAITIRSFMTSAWCPCCRSPCSACALSGVTVAMVGLAMGVHGDAAHAAGERRRGLLDGAHGVRNSSNAAWSAEPSRACVRGRVLEHRVEHALVESDALLRRGVGHGAGARRRGHRNAGDAC